MKDKRILLCRLGGIGDVIHTLPLVKYLRKKYPASSIEYLTSPNVAELLEKFCPYIDKVWEFDKKNKKQICQEITNHSGRIDYFFNLHSSLSFYFVNLFFFRARKFFQYRKEKNIHAVINFARTYDSLISAFELDYNTMEEFNSDELLKKYNLKENKYICIVPGVGKSRVHRGWPFENWLSITKKFLYLNSDLKVVFLGGEDEKKLFDKWYELSKNMPASESDISIPGFKDNAINLLNKLTLPESAMIISKAKKIISCDTGLLHVASAFSKSVIGLYGPTLPERTGPFTGDYNVLIAKNCKCSSGLFDSKKCKITKLPKGFCMDSLTVDNVLSNISGDLTSKQIQNVV